jgi:hypothetical protein
MIVCQMDFSLTVFILIMFLNAKIACLAEKVEFTHLAIVVKIEMIKSMHLFVWQIDDEYEFLLWSEHNHPLLVRHTDGVN